MSEQTRRRGKVKLRIGQKVLAEQVDGLHRQVTVIGRETHNHREFYRISEIPGGLFLSKSLVVGCRCKGCLPSKGMS